MRFRQSIVDSNVLYDMAIILVAGAGTDLVIYKSGAANPP